MIAKQSTPKISSADIKSSIVVFFVALPLCLGIALGSGVPLMSGLIAGIIGGILVGLLSHSQLSVTGPAAGLIAIVLDATKTLPSLPMFFMAVFIAGILQMGLGLLRAGNMAYYIPSNVIKGMLAAIGIIIIMKQIPHAVGWDADAEGDFAFLQADGENTITEIFHAINFISPGAVAVAIVGFFIMILWKKIKISGLSVLPAGLVVVITGIALQLLFAKYIPYFTISSDHLVSVPKFSNLTEFKNLFNFADLEGIKNTKVWVVAATIAIVASIETLLCIEASDKLDPQKRVTNTTRELFAQGAGNMVSGFLGGLPVTSVVVRTSANIDAGAKSKMSAVLHGVLLAVCFLTIPNLLNLIPYSSLAVILIMTGFKLAHPKLFKDMWKQGKWQFAPFIITVLSIYFIDLLWGVFIGLAISVSFILVRNIRNPIKYITKEISKNNEVKLELNEELTFFNKAQTIVTFNSIPSNSRVILDAHKTRHIDYDVLEEMQNFIQVIAPNKNIDLICTGFKSGFGIPNTTSTYEKLLNSKEVTEHAITSQAKSMKERMTPQDALELLKEGNFRFVNNLKINRDIIDQVKLTSQDQHPFAVVLSCIDSRTSAELIFDKGMGDLFSIRIAGNVLNDDILGSMEFACNIVGSKLIVVLGHTKCGAIKGACDCVEMGYLTGLVRKIKPAVDSIAQKLGVKSSSSNAMFVEEVADLNVQLVAKEITAKSEIIRSLVEQKKIMIVGGIYNVESGEVNFHESNN